MEHVNCRALVWETYYGESEAHQFIALSPMHQLNRVPSEGTLREYRLFSRVLANRLNDCSHSQNRLAPAVTAGTT